MKAVGYTHPLPLDAPDALLDIDVPEPELGPRDLLVQVHAVSVNPVDAKVRQKARAAPGCGLQESSATMPPAPCCAAAATAPSSSLGTRSGTPAPSHGREPNAQRHAVDERIVALKPRSLGFAEAAALPLTAITAWELLFDRLGVDTAKGVQPSQRKGTLLIVGGAGGVGSMLLQLASKLTGLHVVATASRPDTVAWCQQLGAHFVLDHHRPLPAQMAELNFPHAEYIASLTGTAQHYPELVEILAPQGKLALIDDPGTLDAMPLKRKSASLHWEYMFARPVFDTPDILRQHDLLTEVARFVDLGYPAHHRDRAPWVR